VIEWTKEDVVAKFRKAMETQAKMKQTEKKGASKITEMPRRPMNKKRQGHFPNIPVI
jgi:hypothetical protein